MTAPTVKLVPNRRRKSGSGWVPWCAGAAAGALMVAGPVYAFTANRPASAASFDVPGPAATAAREWPGMQTMHGGQGTFTVPGQAPPGRYNLSAGSTIQGCSWTLASGSKPKDVISEGSMNRGGFTTFTITSEVRTVTLQGDCWVTRG